MHHAPSVEFPVGRSLMAGCLLLLVWGGGACATGAWMLQAQVGGTRLVGVLGALMLVGFIAAFEWIRSPAGCLGWDGTQWSWSQEGAEDGHPAELAIALDVQLAMLLRVRLGRRQQWLWVHRGSSPGRWLALRRAALAHPPAEGSPAAATSPGAA